MAVGLPNELNLVGCEDNSSWRVIDRAGKDVTPSDQQDYVQTLFAVVNQGTNWKVSDLTSKKVKNVRAEGLPAMSRAKLAFLLFPILWSRQSLRRRRIYLHIAQNPVVHARREVYCDSTAGRLPRRMANRDLQQAKTELHPTAHQNGRAGLDALMIRGGASGRPGPTTSWANATDAFRQCLTRVR